MTRSLRPLWHLARADYLERVRRHGFLVTLAVTVWFAYVATPPNHSPYVTTQIAGARGIYNSAWIGSMVAVLTGVFLSIAGFYVVKNAVRLDRTTGVGQILATTPLSRPLYTLGKALSNFAVLATIVLVVAIASVGMQLVRGEDRHVDFIKLFAPFVIVTLPAMAVVAASAVLFETVPVLSGGLGNLVYVFFVMGVLLGPSIADEEHDVVGNDLMGTRLIVPSMFEAHAVAFPQADTLKRGFSMGFNFHKEGTWDLRTFRWEGVRWSASIVAGRLMWVVVAVAIAFAAAIPFDRFDPSRRPARASRLGRGRAKRVPARERPETRAAQTAAIDSDDVRPYGEERPVAATSRNTSAGLTTPARAPSLARLATAELRLMLWGMPKVWWVIAIGLAIAAAVTPLAVARGFLLPFAWIWPLILWSGMGARARQHQTDALLLSSPHPLARQLSATWLAGLAVTVALGAGVGARLAFAGDGAGLATWGTGAAFVPSMALALGVWSGTGKLFEALYLALWYVGPMNRIPFLDFIGVSSESAAHGTWKGFAAAAVVLCAFAVLGRSRQLRR